MCDKIIPIDEDHKTQLLTQFPRNMLKNGLEFGTEKVSL